MLYYFRRSRRNKNIKRTILIVLVFTVGLSMAAGCGLLEPDDLAAFDSLARKVSSEAQQAF